MQSLLRWSIENSSQDASERIQPAQRQQLDPGIVDMILGKPDAELMKENLAIALDEKKDEDERVEALDNFEMVRL
jgi:hsp70-interacting protein